MVAVIMAGGRGTRIASVASDLPKPMILIDGKPVLEHEIECLRSQGITELILTVSHLKEVIMDYFGDGSGISPVTGEPFGVSIEYFEEHEPLGNAGALFFLRDRLQEDYLLLNADVMFDVDFGRMMRFHREHGGLATILTHPNSHPYDSGLVIADHDHAVTKWMAKEDPHPEFYKNRVNAGVHILSPAVLDGVDVDPDRIGKEDPKSGKIVKVDLDRMVLKPLAGTGKLFCYDSPEYVKDMGTPERYHAVNEDAKLGKIRARNLKELQKAVFLDRDGTINEHIGFLTSPEQFVLCQGAAEAIRMLNSAGYLCIVITNQPVVARGDVTFEELEVIHNKMETLLGAEGAYLDAIYYCPHHKDKGFPGEVPELKIDCDCRKPKPGMILKAAEEYHIDLAASWMIGDARNDVLCGKNAGCMAARIAEEKDEEADLTVGSLLEFVTEHLLT